MAADEEAIAEARRRLGPILAVKRGRFHAKNQRDCGGASVIGAATVAISLLIGGVKVTVTAFWILLGAQLLLIYTALIFASLTGSLRDRDSPDLVPTIFPVATAIAGLSGYFAYELKRHGSNVGSLSWWLLLGLAGLGAVLGLVIRRSAESLLDTLDDESWKQRIAPLVSEQKRAVEEIGALGVLLRNAPAEAPGTGEK
jgi:hypothetical protein